MKTRKHTLDRVDEHKCGFLKELMAFISPYGN